MDADEAIIDFRRLAHAIMRRKWVVLASVVLGTAAGYFASLHSTRYVSEGLLLMPNVALGDYRRYEVALANRPRLESFLSLSKVEDESVIRSLRGMLETPGGLAAAVRPEFTHTDRDMKQFGVKFDEPGDLVGVRLRLVQARPDDKVPVMALAEYVRDTALKVDLESRLLNWCLRYDARQQELRNEQLESDFSISQQEARAATLRDIIARTPGAAELDGRQLVSIENGGERYLPPVAQLVATETLIGDIKLERVKRERERVAATLKREYYCGARSMLETPVAARDFLAKLDGLHESLFKDKDLTVNILEQTANTFELQRAKWANNYLRRSRFVASPQGAIVVERRPGLATGTLAGALLGLIFGVALAIFGLWWRRNRDLILSKDD